MKTLRSPEEVLNEFINGIDAMNDDQLAALLCEKCDFSNDLDVYDKDMSLVSKIPKENQADYSTQLAFSLLDYLYGQAIVILARLAVKKYVTSFNLVLEALKGWPPYKSSAVSYINLPNYCEVFFVQYTEYDNCENPREVMDFVMSGKGESDPSPAWKFNESGFIEPYCYQGLLSEFIYNLDEVSFEKLGSATRIVDDKIEIELNISQFFKVQDGEVLNALLPSRLCYDIGGSICDAKKFGNKSRSLEVATIVESL